MSWVDVEGLTDLPCRLDLQFLRPGKDAPPAIQAGVIPDREGIMFCDPLPNLRAGMRVVTKPDKRGREVVKGTFEIKEIPGEALDYDSVHHIEVKVIETTQEQNMMPNIPNNVESSDNTPGP